MFSRWKACERAVTRDAAFRLEGPAPRFAYLHVLTTFDILSSASVARAIVTESFLLASELVSVNRFRAFSSAFPFSATFTIAPIDFVAIPPAFFVVFLLLVGVCNASLKFPPRFRRFEFAAAQKIPHHFVVAWTKSVEFRV